MQDKKTMRISEAMWAIRKCRKLTIRKFAKAVGVHYATLNRLERGENPDAQTLAAVLRWLL